MRSTDYEPSFSLISPTPSYDYAISKCWNENNSLMLHAFYLDKILKQTNYGMWYSV